MGSDSFRSVHFGIVGVCTGSLWITVLFVDLILTTCVHWFWQLTEYVLIIQNWLSGVCFHFSELEARRRQRKSWSLRKSLQRRLSQSRQRRLSQSRRRLNSQSQRRPNSQRQRRPNKRRQHSTMWRQRQLVKTLGHQSPRVQPKIHRRREQGLVSLIRRIFHQQLRSKSGREKFWMMIWPHRAQRSTQKWLKGLASSWVKGTRSGRPK